MKFLTICAVSMALTACEEGQGFNLFGPKETTETGEVAPTVARTGEIVERDVEAPDVFQVTDTGLWDGRPSLGGVWVAHSDVGDPHRVIIRNESNGKFVIGALFRRERETPGPRIQVSSEAAVELDMLAGQPAELNVTALIREEIEELPPEIAPDAQMAIDEPGDIEETTLDPIEAASAAIGDDEEPPAITPAAEASATIEAPATAQTPAPTAAAASGLDKPFIQIGIFSVEENAENTATSMRQAGMVPIVHEQSANDRPFWRVVVGPATNTSERAELLRKVKDLGFEDAYFVTR